MNNLPRIFRLSDSYTGRSAVIRLASKDDGLTIGQLLEKYLLNLPESHLLKNGATTPESLDGLKAIQDLVYACDNAGRLTTMYAGLLFRQDGELVGLNDRPATTETRSGDTPISVINLTIDRTNVGYDRNSTGFHRRRWANNPTTFQDFVTDTLERQLGTAHASQVMSLDSPEDRLLLLKDAGTTSVGQ